MKRFVKRLLPTGRHLRKIKSGIGAGSWMWLDLHDQLQRFLGLDEREPAPYVNPFVRECPTLVDVGANDGLYTIHFLASAAEQVIACEPGEIKDRLLANA